MVQRIWPQPTCSGLRLQGTVPLTLELYSRECTFWKTKKFIFCIVVIFVQVTKITIKFHLKMFFLNVYFYMFNLKRFLANLYILFFSSCPLPSISVPRKLNIHGFLDKTHNHWIDML